MPYLTCPSCRRTAWMDTEAESEMTCRHCETALTPLTDAGSRFLVAAVRERFARDARLDHTRRRFVRD